MLKRNLIAIAIVVLGLGITNAFGQEVDPRPKSVRKGTLKKPTSGKSAREAGSGMATGIKARNANAKSLCENQTIPGKSSNARSRKTTAKSLCENQTIPWELRKQKTSSNSTSRRSTNQKIVKKPANWSFGTPQQVPTQNVRRVKKP